MNQTDKFKDNISNYKGNLTSLKDNLIKIVESSTSSNELNRKFMELASKDPDNMDLFQTLMLMQDISSTSHKNFKSSMIEAINILINTKIDSYNQMEELHHRVSSLEISRSKQVKIPLVGNVPVRESLFFLVMLFVLLVTSYIKEPEATSKAVDTLVEKTKSQVGVN